MRNKIIIACVIFVAFVLCLFIILKPKKVDEGSAQSIQEQIDLGVIPESVVDEYVTNNTVESADTQSVIEVPSLDDGSYRPNKDNHSRDINITVEYFDDFPEDWNRNIYDTLVDMAKYDGWFEDGEHITFEKIEYAEPEGSDIMHYYLYVYNYPIILDWNYDTCIMRVITEKEGN